MITASSLTNGTLTVIFDNGADLKIAQKDHPKWNELIEAYKSQNEFLLRSLFSLKSVVEHYSNGDLTIDSTGVTYRGRPLHTVDTARVMTFIKEKIPYDSIANYIARKMLNPSARAIEEMYNFLECKQMPLTPKGTFIAYKGVRNDYYSITGNLKTVVIQGKVDGNGRIWNGIGETIEVERSSVDDNFTIGCSFGLHVGSLSYAKGFGQHLLLVEVDPPDVISVPSDCNCSKCRCCKYKVIGEYTGPMPDTYTAEFHSQTPAARENEEPSQFTNTYYDQGFQLGKMDVVENNCGPFYSENDLSNSESFFHKKYIEGYLDGYKNGNQELHDRPYDDGGIEYNPEY